MSLEQTIATCVRRAAESLGYEVVDLRIDGRRHARIWIDKAGGVTVVDCANVNRAANQTIREDGLDSGTFQLEVLSPGLDRPLTQPHHFERFVGQTATVRLARKRGDRRNWKGKIIAFRDGAVILREDGHPEETFPLAEIEESRLVPEITMGAHKKPHH